MDHKAQLDQTEVLALASLRLASECLDLLDHLEMRVPLAHPDNQEPLECQEPMEPVELDFLVQLERQGQSGHQELLEQTVRQVMRHNQDHLVQLEHLAILDRLDQMVHQEKPELQASLERTPPTAHALLEVVC